MYELTFNRDEIARWARFSGDYNPIHFDPDRARQLGAEDVIAHGMLVLLAVKGRLSQALPPGAGGWWLLRSRMRQPVVAGTPTRLETSVRGNGLAFSLASPAGRKLMTGSLARLAECPSVLAAGTPNRVPAEAVGGRVRELTHAFPWPREFWVAADALVFAEFLRTGVRDILAPQGIDLSRGEVTAANGTVVVQTTHDVAFDRDFLGDARAAALDIEALPPQAEAVDDGVSATCQLGSRCGGRLVMLTTLGLFIRQAPVAQRNQARAA
jgi:hypothetical protein